MNKYSNLIRNLVLRNSLIICLLIPIVITSLKFVKCDYDISSFIMIGDLSSYEDLFTYDVKVHKNSSGYDGQYFYHIALNPKIHSNKHSGVATGDMVYRRQRILYPLLCHVIVLGNLELIPWAMVLINLGSLFMLFFFTSKILEHFSIDKSNLLVLGIFSGLYLSLSRNLAEPMSIMFLSISLYCLLKQKLFLFVLVSICALFTREDTVFFILPSIIYFSFITFKQNSKFKWVFISLTFLPLASFFIYRQYLNSQFKSYDELNSVMLSKFPFQGIIEGIKSNIENNLFNPNDNIGLIAFSLYTIILLGWNFSTFLYAFKYFKFDGLNIRTLLSLSCLLWFGFSLFLSNVIFLEDYGFGRIYSGLTYLSFLIISIGANEWNMKYVAFTTIIFISVVLKIIYIP